MPFAGSGVRFAIVVGADAPLAPMLSALPSIDASRAAVVGPSVTLLPTGCPAERIDAFRSSIYESCRFRFKLALKLLLRDILPPPFNGLIVSMALFVVATKPPPPLPLPAKPAGLPLRLCATSAFSLPLKSLMERIDGERCMDNETGIVVMRSLASKPLGVVVMVGICVAPIGTIFNVPVDIVSAELVVMVKGKESVVIFVVTGAVAGEIR